MPIRDSLQFTEREAIHNDRQMQQLCTLNYFCVGKYHKFALCACARSLRQKALLRVAGR